MDAELYKADFFRKLVTDVLVTYVLQEHPRTDTCARGYACIHAGSDRKKKNYGHRG